MGSGAFAARSHEFFGYALIQEASALFTFPIESPYTKGLEISQASAKGIG